MSALQHGLAWGEAGAQQSERGLVPAGGSPPTGGRHSRQGLRGLLGRHEPPATACGHEQGCWQARFDRGQGWSPGGSPLVQLVGLRRHCGIPAATYSRGAPQGRHARCPRLLQRAPWLGAPRGIPGAVHGKCGHHEHRRCCWGVSRGGLGVWTGRTLVCGGRQVIPKMSDEGCSASAAQESAAGSVERGGARRARRGLHCNFQALVGAYSPCIWQSAL